jgi:hypothetical protein
MLDQNGCVSAEAELAWPTKKVAVFLPGQMIPAARFKRRSWKVIVLSNVIDKVQQIIDLLRE